VLERAQTIGLLGPGPVEPHLDHALALAGLLGPAPARFLDLGSGGGLPGLVLALVWPDARGSLVDTKRRATDWLAEAIETLALRPRIDVRSGRAEDLAREPELRGGFGLVVARGFGPPAATAESGVGFLAAGGRLAVSEPPGDHDPTRWPDVGLAELGLSPAVRLRSGATGLAVMTSTTGPLDPWPRRSGLPRKRPQWTVTTG
jgi:16S rRNA (guanine527-N7)-methyltransferase